jgi:hypothetical protein
LKCDPNTLFGWNERALPENEILLLNYYRLLSDEGKAAANGTVRGLVDSGAFQKEPGGEKMAAS